MDKASNDIYNLMRATFRKEPSTLYEAKTGHSAEVVDAKPASVAATKIAATAATAVPTDRPCTQQLVRVHAAVGSAVTDEELEIMLRTTNKLLHKFAAKWGRIGRTLIGPREDPSAEVVSNVMLDGPDRGKPLIYPKDWTRVCCFNTDGSPIPALASCIDTSFISVAGLLFKAVAGSILVSSGASPIDVWLDDSVIVVDSETRRAVAYPNHAYPGRGRWPSMATVSEKESAL